MRGSISLRNDTDQGLKEDEIRTMDPDQVRDAGHVMNCFNCATLIERVVRFMDRYNRSSYA